MNPREDRILESAAVTEPVVGDVRAQPRRRGAPVHLPMVVLVLVSILLAIGLITLFSASAYARGNDPYFFIERQALYIGCAALAGIIMAFTPIALLRRFIWIAGAGLVGLLLLTLVPGVGLMVKGSRRWLDLGPMNLQASELAKVVLVLILAHYLSANQSSLRSLVKGFLVPISIIGVVCLLILKQPDFGTAALCGLIGMTLLFLAGVPMRFLAPTTLLAMAAFAGKIYLDPIRRERITSFLNLSDEQTKLDGAYQLWQAILAFGAGGIHGVGIGNGRQQHNFLPEAHNDFILAITGEEMGMLATLGVVAVFMALFTVGLFQIRRAPNLFHYLVLCGCFCCITFQAIINLGVVTGLFPTKGMSLPFVSYGGSNLLLMGIVIGLMFNLHRASIRMPVLTGGRDLRALPQ